MRTREQERQIEARHLAQDLALEGANADAIRGALREGQFDECLDDREIEHILSENAVVEEIELKQGNKSSHHLIRFIGGAVMLAGGVVWYLWGFDVIPMGAVVFGFLLAWVPERAFLIFSKAPGSGLSVRVYQAGLERGQHLIFSPLPNT